MSDIGKKCPHCKKEIEGFTHIRSGSVSQKCSLTNKCGSLDYDSHDDFIEDGVVTEYNCPFCGITLFNNEHDAIKFLKGMN